MHFMASDSFADTLNADTHSSQNYANAPEIDTCIANDAPIENDDILISLHDSTIRHDTDSIASAEISIPTDQTEEPTQEQTFSRGVKCNLRPSPYTNFSHSNQNSYTLTQ